MRVTRIVVLTIPLLATLAPSALRAQGTRTDYDRAYALNERFQGLVIDAPGTPAFIGDTDRFWYRKSVRGGNEFVLVDATTREKRPAFDHARLAATLSAARDTTYTALDLPFTRISFVDGEQSIEFAAADSLWRCTLADYACRRTGPAPRFGRGSGQFQRQPNDQPRVSPDGKWEALIVNYNVHVREPGSTESIPLSQDGSEGNYYSLQSIVWSPDSRKLVAYRVVPGYRRIVRYIESSPADQLQPEYMERVYAKPGDVLDKDRPVLFDVATRIQTEIDDSLFPNAYGMARFEWRQDSRAFTFEYNQRGHQVYRVIEVDAATGAARAVITETSETFIDYRR
ncbi:MAG: DPP IV N-terminal domain-containing protein, partial [Gemmatimonadota bacterium]